MKKLFTFLALVFAVTFIATSCLAGPTLEWQLVSGEPDGYVLYYKVLTDTDYVACPFGPGTVREYDLSQLGLTGGVRYELYLTATKDGSESAPSDILRYTYPVAQQVVEIPEDNRPVNIIINVR